MFDRCDDSWTARAQPLDDAEVVVIFVTQDRFLTGDPNNPAHFDDPAQNVTLTHSAPEGYVRLSDFAARQDRLIAHYREIAILAARHGKPFNHIRQHFWMRISIGKGTVGISFAWYSHWQEFDRLLAWIETATEGERFDDVDQGWDFVMLRRGDSFYARETDPEDGSASTEFSNVRLPAALLIAAARQARRDGPAAIARLTAMLGTDVWTRYRYDKDLVIFGTADWTPTP
jgi:hypothetical protein